MVPEISEFSYGFALTNELVGWKPLCAAPIFPSLIEEGKAGGGYDVKLDWPGTPLYLQFKRADCLTRSSAREISKFHLELIPPFFRFGVTERNRSLQHASLIELDDGNRLVFYAAPRFHTLNEINSAWSAGNVAQRSIFISPSAIGEIIDDEKHAVSYDEHHTYFCSKPRAIVPTAAGELLAALQQKLRDDRRPLREQLGEWKDHIERATVRARAAQEVIKMRISGRKRVMIGDERGPPMLSLDTSVVRYDRATEAPPIVPPSIETREPRALDPSETLLRSISDEALHQFGAQLFVVQEQPD